jgi:hypothetical protein
VSPGFGIDDSLPPARFPRPGAEATAQGPEEEEEVEVSVAEAVPSSGLSEEAALAAGGAVAAVAEANFFGLPSSHWLRLGRGVGPGRWAGGEGAGSRVRFNREIESRSKRAGSTRSCTLHAGENAHEG